MSYNYMGSRPLDDSHERHFGNCELQKFYRWSFLLSSMGNSLILIGLTIAELTSFANNNKNDASFTFDIAILFIGLIASWFAFHGIIFEYQYDIYLHLVSMVIALIYCWVDYGCNGVDFPTVKFIRSVVISSLLLPTFLFSLCVTCSEYWTEFYIIGASEEILNMYKKLRCFLSLLKFDFQTIVVMGIFTIRNGVESTVKDIIPLVAILIYALLFWVLVSYGVQNEYPLPLFIFVLGSIAPPIWVTYKFVSENCLVALCTRFVAGLNYTGFSAGVLAVVVRMFILIELMKVYRNFGYGLSDRAFSYLISPESTSLLGRPRRRSL